MRLHRAFTALAAVFALTACEKNAVQTLTGTMPSASIKFFNFAVGAPAMHFFAGDVKMSGTVTTGCQAAVNPPVTRTDTLCLTQGIESTAGVGYGGVTAGALYTGIDAGQHTLTGRATAAATKGQVISSLDATIAEGRAYSYFASGRYNTTTRTSDAFIVEDNFPAEFDWTGAYVRFVNGIFNANPMTLYVTNTDATQNQTPIAIGGEVAYKNGGAFVRVPVGLYNLQTRYASGANAIARTNISFNAGRVYTITAMGDITVTTGTSSGGLPFLDNTVNR